MDENYTQLHGSHLLTLLEGKISTSVRIGSVFLPIVEAQSYLAKHVKPVVVHSGVDTYPFFLRGSGSCLKFCDSQLMIATSHQLYCSFSKAEINPKDVGILISQRGTARGSTLVTSGGFSRYQVHTRAIDSHAKEICSFDFSSPALQVPELDDMFYAVGNDLRFDEFEKALGFLGYGYRYNDQGFPDSELDAVKFRVRMYTMEFEKRTSDDSLVVLRAVSEGAIDHNGISGGPVFAIVDSGGFLSIKFAGIVCLASNRIFHVLRSASIANALRLFRSLNY